MSNQNPENGGVTPAQETSKDDVLLSVSNLKMHFPITRGIILQRQVGSIKAVDGVNFDLIARRNTRPGGRVRLRKIHHWARHITTL